MAQPRPLGVIRWATRRRTSSSPPRRPVRQQRRQRLARYHPQAQVPWVRDVVRRSAARAAFRSGPCGIRRSRREALALVTDSISRRWPPDTREGSGAAVCYEPEFALDLTKWEEGGRLPRRGGHPAPCRAIPRPDDGFAPGLPHGGLDESLAVPRRASPRATVPAGSGDRQRADRVLSYAISGGWNVSGPRPKVLFDATRPRRACSGRETGSSSRHQSGGISRAAEKFMRRARAAAGLLTTLQDHGRHGFKRVGCVRGRDGPGLARARNALVGNPTDEAALEITVIGRSWYSSATRGRGLRAEFQGSFPHNRPVLRPRERSSQPSCRATRGARAYIAVAGGLASTRCSAAAARPAGHFGGLRGQALKHGDVLPLRDDAASKGSVAEKDQGRHRHGPAAAHAADREPILVHVIEAQNFRASTELARAFFDTVCASRPTPTAGLRRAGRRSAGRRPMRYYRAACLAR